MDVCAGDRIKIKERLAVSGKTDGCLVGKEVEVVSVDEGDEQWDWDPSFVLVLYDGKEYWTHKSNVEEVLGTRS